MIHLRHIIIAFRRSTILPFVIYYQPISMRTTLKKQKLHTEPRLSNVSIKLIFVLIYKKKKKKKKKKNFFLKKGYFDFKKKKKITNV